MNQSTNPREMIGGNNPPLSLEERLARDYDEMLARKIPLLEAAKKLPKVLDAQHIDEATDLVRKMRELSAEIEQVRVAEKEPFLRDSRLVDAKFHPHIDQLTRREKKAPAGAADIVQARLNDFVDRQVRAEEERRKVELEKAQREAEELRKAAEKAAAEAEEARAAAERARGRKGEKSAIADQAEEAAASAAAEAAAAADRQEGAYIGTLQSATAAVKISTESGVTLGVGTEKYAEVEDATKLDKDLLWPFISLAEKEKALRAWAKSTGHTQKMAGARIGSRSKAMQR